MLGTVTKNLYGSTIELELIEAAIYTDPDDQSAWLYYRWVVGRGKCD